jgi:hypothetical protein
MTVYHRYDLDDATDSGRFEPMSGIDSLEDFDKVLANSDAEAFEDEGLARRAFKSGHDIYTFVDPYVEATSGRRVLVVTLSEKLAQAELEDRMSLVPHDLA